jgi:hypothetical protein
VSAARGWAATATATAAALAAIAAGWTVDVPALAAATPLPRVPTELEATAADHSLQVRPRAIVYTGDGTGVIAGERSARHGAGIRWTSWTGQFARGTGADWLDDCRPDCAGGHFHGYPARIVAWRPRRLRGTRVFTRLTLFYERRVPAGQYAHDTFTAAVSSGGLGYGPPDARADCHLRGAAPEPGCANVHSLPPMGTGGPAAAR